LQQNNIVGVSCYKVLENKVTSLPWLEGKKAAKQQEQKELEAMGVKQEPVFKPYQSGK